MGNKSLLSLAVAAFCLSVVGCIAPPDARYVYQDGQYGVIGIPRNTSLGKKDYRAQAYELMTRHFPEGYEIVRAEEVIEGERTLDTALKVELDSEPGVAALNQIIKVGKFAKMTSSDQKDTIKITESRILYRRKPDGATSGHDGFTNMANLSPELYIDPNDEVRKGLTEAILLVKKEKEKEAAKIDDKTKVVVDAKTKAGKDLKVDLSVQKTGGETEK